VLLNRRDSTLCLLNPTATQVYQLLSAGLSEPEAVAWLHAEYGVPAEIVSRDVSGLLLEWRRAGLLRSGDDGAAGEGADNGELVPARRVSTGCRRVYRVFEACLEVRYETAALEEQTHPGLAHLEYRGPVQPAHELDVYRDAEGVVVGGDGIEVARTADAANARSLVIGQLAMRSFPECELLGVLHAAAVADGPGCVVLPGPAGTGKSTLVAALDAAGLIVLTDDCVPVAAGEGLVYPFPVALMLREGSWPLLDSRCPALAATPTCLHGGAKVRYLPPTEPASPRAGAPPKRLVFPRYAPGSDTHVTDLAAGEALARLLAADVWLKRPLTPARASEFVRWVDALPALELTFGALDEAVAVVLALARTEKLASRLGDVGAGCRLSDSA